MVLKLGKKWKMHNFFYFLICLQFIYAELEIHYVKNDLRVYCVIKHKSKT